jgi:hypothetical protein
MLISNLDIQNTIDFAVIKKQNKTNLNGKWNKRRARVFLVSHTRCVILPHMRTYLWFALCRYEHGCYGGHMPHNAAHSTEHKCMRNNRKEQNMCESICMLIVNIQNRITSVSCLSLALSIDISCYYSVLCVSSF